jgi:AmmeMemoRadiSam system protein A
VTLKKAGDLRGCIGHIEAVEPLWQDIRDNAVAAALYDRRFTPVQAAELASLELEVSILTPLTAVAGPAGFEVGRHGVVLSQSGRRAVFLPQVAPEQGWDRDTTLNHLARKAGLLEDAWRQPGARFEVFEAQVFGERTLAR